jgi:hypothetical protein
MPAGSMESVGRFWSRILIFAVRNSPDAAVLAKPYIEEYRWRNRKAPQSAVALSFTADSPPEAKFCKNSSFFMVYGCDIDRFFVSITITPY